MLVATPVIVVLATTYTLVESTVIVNLVSSYTVQYALCRQLYLLPFAASCALHTVSPVES